MQRCRTAPVDVNSQSGSMGSSRGAVRAKNPKQRKVSTKRTGHVERKQGLLLDDFLAATDQMRRHFQLPVPQFGLKEMEQWERWRKARTRFSLVASIRRHP